MSVSFLTRPSAPAIAYQKEEARNAGLPTIVFFTGFRSDMKGTKAAFLANMCQKTGQGYIRFDYRGHGASGGRFEEGTITLWLEDALAVIDELTRGPLILVGSSMGGWIALLAARERKDRVYGLVGLAAAPDFTRDIKVRMNDDQRKILERDGRFFLNSDYAPDPHPITNRLLQDGEKHCLLDQRIDLECPLRLVHGMKDSDVPWKTADRIAEAWTGSDKKVYIQAESDHRLSSDDDLALLEKICRELSAF